MEYFVSGNLKHNGKRYKRGDTVELTAEAAMPLLAVGVITSDKSAVPEAPVDAPAPEIGQKPEPIVGGEPSSTGEPSVEWTDTASAGTMTTDITPVVNPEPEIDPSAGL